jgi:putative Ca2+/H+ antiporter (TMEM165/GDT1 family)
MSLALFAAAYLTILTAELVGDKTLYSVSALASRYSPAAILAGLAPAFMAKMLAAVLLGGVIASLPGGLVRGITAVALVATGLVIFFRSPEPSASAADAPSSRLGGAGAAFAAVFFTEWGDPGQIAAATLAARYQAPAAIWAAATLAMLTKGVLALTLGLGLRRFLPPRALRYGSALLCVALGVAAAVWPEHG